MILEGTTRLIPETGVGLLFSGGPWRDDLRGRNWVVSRTPSGEDGGRVSLRKTGLTMLMLGGTVFTTSAMLPFALSAFQARGQRVSELKAIPALPSVDVVVPAYLEAGCIASKITSLRKSLAQHDGTSRIIVIASDFETAEAADSADLVILTDREGKAQACNTGIQAANADVVVFTDANCEILPAEGWVRLVLLELREWHLVSARKGESGGMDGLFWRLEEQVKAATQSSGGTLAVAGEFLATRLCDIRPLTPSVILDDLEIAMDYALRNLTVTVSQHIRTVEPASEPSEQWERRIRIAQGLWSEALPKAPSLWTSPVGRLFIAHKLARVTVGSAAFWIAVLGASILGFPASLSVMPITLYAVAGYAGRVPLPPSLGPLAAVFGLQAVPLVAVGRTARRTHIDGAPYRAELWRKIAR